mmetsp:Transcript_41410/g.119194  ORF Transcript_41410/g.119194 Transcript_41410/m.119194 type:complete len:214 (+) Transcript_41410:1739-2380(+)
MHQIVFLCRTITDIRFLSDVKANSCNTVNLRSMLPGPFNINSDVCPAFLRTRLSKVTPISCAAWTSATSSGDMPEKNGCPSFVATCTEWQTAKQVAMLSNGSKDPSASLPARRMRLVSASPAPAEPSAPGRNSPKSWPPQWHLAKTISFAVKVPVLSEKRKSTWPISSMISAVRAWALHSRTGSYICESVLTWKARSNFIISYITYRLKGTTW